MNIRNFKWTRQPTNYRIDENSVEITTAPHTDLWQRTYYHFQNDNAPVFQMETERIFQFCSENRFFGKPSSF